MNSDDARVQLQELIEKQVHELQKLKTRFAYFKSMEDDLAPYAKGGRFIPKNESLWDINLDAYEFLIVRLADLCKSLVEGRGFIGKLNACRGLLKRRSHDTGESDRYLAQEIQKRRDAIFARHFPKDADKPTPTESSVLDLKNAIEERTQRLKTCRDKLHAHRLQEQARSKKNWGETLSLAEIEEIFIFLETLVSDMSVLALGTQRGFYASSDDTQGVVDLILHGTMGALINKTGMEDALEGHDDPEPYFWQKRQKFYAGPAWAQEQSEWPW